MYCLFLLLVYHWSFAQVRIHAHNDYQQAEPLNNALRNQVYSIEADVWLINDTIKVAHDARELPMAPSLFSLYLQPIIRLFEINQGHVTRDSGYSPILMIDIKEKGNVVITELVKLLSAYQTVFNRNVNPSAIQIVISGDRGDNWQQWPSFILFDGRPNEQYDEAGLKRIAFISDSYFNYSRQKDTVDSAIQKLADTVHRQGKLLRLWAIPDTPLSWDKLQKLGVDIINTDKVEDCHLYFKVK